MQTVSHHPQSYNNTPASIHPIRPGIQEDEADYHTDQAPSFVVAVDVDVTRSILGSLGSSAHSTYALLETYCDVDGNAWPSIETLATGCKLDPKTIKRAMAVLVRDGWVIRTERYNRFGVHAGYTYHLPYHIKPRTNEGDIARTRRGHDADTTRTNAPPEVSTKVIPNVDTKREYTPPLPPSPEKVVRADAAPDQDDLRFERFWKSYPSKTGKGDARKAWAKLRPKPDDDRTDELIASVECQKRSDRWQRGFIPNPSTWLNQGRWDDELPQAPAAFSSNGSPPTSQRKGLSAQEWADYARQLEAEGK